MARDRTPQGLVAWLAEQPEGTAFGLPARIFDCPIAQFREACGLARTACPSECDVWENRFMDLYDGRAYHENDRCCTSLGDARRFAEIVAKEYPDVC